MKIHGITPVSGQSTVASKKPAGGSLGDPYKPVCDHLHALLTRKRGYYGCPDTHPLANALGVEEDGIDPWVYQLARIGEKRRRLHGAAAANDTLVVETLYDIMGHAAVAIAILKDRMGE